MTYFYNTRADKTTLYENVYFIFITYILNCKQGDMFNF